MPRQENLFADFEKRHLRQSARFIRSIRKVYEDAIQEVTTGLEFIQVGGNIVRVSDYPLLKRRIDAAIRRMKPTVYSLVVNGVKASWDLANSKNNMLVDARLGDRKPTAAARRILYDPNSEAMTAFLNRKEGGLNLSSRVWNLVDPFRHELEAGLGLGISEGKPAAAMATEMKKYLKEPEKLFRRVRDSQGKLVLSRAAQEYNPGRGVYRSSYKNALRLSRTENNMAYRTADHERWKTLPFVTGVEVKLSAAHPRYDICDPLAGEYPKDFKFVGWHPQCLCYAIPKMMTDQEYEKLEDYVLGLEDDPGTANSVQRPHKGFTNYLKENRERIAGWKNTPYFIRDNPDYVRGF